MVNLESVYLDAPKHSWYIFWNSEESSTQFRVFNLEHFLKCEESQQGASFLQVKFAQQETEGSLVKVPG